MHFSGLLLSGYDVFYECMLWSQNKMHVADLYSSPSSEHLVQSAYYMLYWIWHSRFKKQF